jgi:hypothetical protein
MYSIEWMIFVGIMINTVFLVVISRQIDRSNVSLLEIKRLLEWSARKQGWLSDEEKIHRSFEG